jgi:hypothetical protein
MPSAKATLELAHQPLELAHALAEGGVLGLQPGEGRGGLVGPRLPPAGDAAAGRANALGAAARQGAAADGAQGVRTSGGTTSGIGRGEDPAGPDAGSGGRARGRRGLSRPWLRHRWDTGGAHRRPHRGIPGGRPMGNLPRRLPESVGRSSVGGCPRPGKRTPKLSAACFREAAAKNAVCSRGLRVGRRTNRCT